MKSKPNLHIITPATLLASAGMLFATSIAPTPPLAERLREAEKVFVGTLVERVEDGEWVRAALHVDEPLRGVEEKERVEVIWRTRVRDLQVYDAGEGSRGIAILKDKHEGRYWLRADKFEPLAKLDEVRKLLEEGAQQGIPTFGQWVKDGKPIPPDMVFTGGTPWFDETKGERRSDEEVYEILFGKPAAAAKEEPKDSRFPAHWGDPPQIQTRDLRPLPGGYGRGSSTLYKWIEANMEKDARKAKEESGAPTPPGQAKP